MWVGSRHFSKRTGTAVLTTTRPASNSARSRTVSTTESYGTVITITPVIAAASSLLPLVNELRAVPPDHVGDPLRSLARPLATPRTK